MVTLNKKYTGKIGDAKATLETFAGVSDLRQRMETVPEYGDSSFAGGTWDDALGMLETGHAETFTKVRDLADKIQTGVDLTSTIKRPQASPFGRVRVGAFLAGVPQPCVRIQRTESTQGALTVWANTCASAGVQADDLAGYLVALQAFCLAISKTRPVRLMAFQGLQPGRKTSYKGRYAMAVEVPLSPSDAVSLSSVASPLFLRRLGFALAYDNHGKTSGSLGWAGSASAVAKALGADLETDIVTPDLHLRVMREALADPVAYVQGQVDRFLKGEGTAFQAN